MPTSIGCRLRRYADDARNLTGRRKLPNGFAMNPSLLEPPSVPGK
jgi:hypothetical protein